MGMPQIYQTRDFKTEKLKELYGANPSKRQLKRFNKYINSEQGQKDWLAFEDQESDKYFKSWDDRKAARFKQWDEQVARTKSEIEKMGQNSQPAEVTTPAATTPPIKKVESPAITPQNAYGLLSSVQSQLQGIGTYNSGVTLGDGIFQTRNQNPLAGKLPGLHDYASSANDEADEKTEFAYRKGKDNYYADNNAYLDFMNIFKETTGNNFRTSDPEHKKAYDSWIQHYYNDNGFDLFGNRYTAKSVAEEQVAKKAQEEDEVMQRAKLNPLAQSYLATKNAGLKKQGGTMNKVKYFAQGGQPQTQNDIQRQVEALVEAAMAGDQKATQQVNQIMEAAKAGDQKATQLAQMIQVAAQKLQGQATMNKWGSKLTYIKSLKFAKGGKHTCPACEQKVEMKKCGKKIKKHFFGGDFYVNDAKNPMIMSDGTRMVGVIHKQGFKNGTNRGMSQTLYDSTGKPIIQKDRTSNGGEREIYYNVRKQPIKRKGLFGPSYVMVNDTVQISGTPEMFENAPNMSTPEIKEKAYRFAQGMD